MYYRYIHAALRIKSNDFGDPLTVIFTFGDTKRTRPVKALVTLTDVSWKMD